jgi:hypothetical protein
MRVRTAGVELAPRAVWAPGQALAFRRAVALALLGHDDPWHVLASLKQRAENLRGGLLVAAALPQYVADVILALQNCS